MYKKYMGASIMIEEELDLTDCHGDVWAEMGKIELGQHNILWGDKVGFLMLQKAILNDYWADAPIDRKTHWDKNKINTVMSKLYYCWVKLLEKEEK